jgi:hypothetical protein
VRGVAERPESARYAGSVGALRILEGRSKTMSVAEGGTRGGAAAGRTLRMPKSTLSHCILKLEKPTSGSGCSTARHGVLP